MIYIEIFLIFENWFSIVIVMIIMNIIKETYKEVMSDEFFN